MHTLRHHHKKEKPMDWEKVIMYGLIGLAVSLAMNYMNKGASQEIEKSTNGEIELRMNKLYQILGYLSIGFASSLVIAALFYQEQEMYIVGIAMLLLFGGLGIPCLMYYQNHKLRFDDEKITVQNWRKKIKEIAWREIDDIRFNPFSGYLEIRGLDKKMAIHQHLVGLKKFTDKMEEKTKWRTSELKLPIK